jgi:hypothetical protein
MYMFHAFTCVPAMLPTSLGCVSRVVNRIHRVGCPHSHPHKLQLTRELRPTLTCAAENIKAWCSVDPIARPMAMP